MGVAGWSTTTRRRVDCPVCGRAERAVKLSGHIHKHKVSDEPGAVWCTRGSGYFVGTTTDDVASVTCPTCKGVGTIRPGTVKP